MSDTRMGEHDLLDKEGGQLLKFLATSLSTLRCLTFPKSSAPLHSILEICVYLAHISLSDLQCPTLRNQDFTDNSGQLAGSVDLPEVFQTAFTLYPYGP